ncbi:MAG: ATP-binding protein [Desulfurococcaceae archaeon]
MEVENGERYIVIGKILNSLPEYKAKLYESSLFKHILITGTTGSGKSYTASVIAIQVASELNINVFILDWHSEYSNILSDHVYLDPYSIPLQIFTDDQSDLSIVSSILELTPSQEYLLDRIIRRTPLDKIKTVEGLLDIVESYPEESSWLRETKLSLHRKLNLLTRGKDNELFRIHGSSELERFLRDQLIKPVIIDLGRISDLNTRRLYGAFFARRLVNIAIDHEKPLLLILEEAQNYLSKEQPVKPICDMLREVRKFKVGIIVVSQSTSQLVEDVSVNTNTKIIHALKSNQDIEVIEKTLYIDREILSIIPYMEPGEAVYSTPYLKKPVLIKIKNI